ncbi:MAG: alanine racemase, partial [Nevskia sp.]|nr:alanine racemase [Nevskia sp.]
MTVYIPRVTATIDLSAIRHNLGRVRAFAPASKVMAAIKADAYGHGAVRVGRALQQAGVDACAVACLEEALVLREAGLDGAVNLLEGVLSLDEAEAASRLRLQVVVHDFWQLELLQGLPPQRPLSLWFKLDSGMNRLGFPPSIAPALYQALRQRPDWQLAGWLTHLACADETANPMTQRQLETFSGALGDLPGPRSAANSAGLIAWPGARLDWVRPGLMLYGASPLPGRSAADLGLKAAMRVESRLIAVHQLEAGDTVGYGATFRCPEPMRVGVGAVG